MDTLTFDGLTYAQILSARPEDYLDQAVALDLKALKVAIKNLSANIFWGDSESLAKLFAFRREQDWRMRETGKTRKVRAPRKKKEVA